MSILFAVRKILNDNLPVFAICSDRWYPNAFPENVIIPYGVYQRVDEIPVSSHSGSSGYAFTRMQLTLWAATFADIEAFFAAVKNALIDYRGTVNTININRIEFIPINGDRDSVTQLHFQLIDLRVHHTNL